MQKHYLFSAHTCDVKLILLNDLFMRITPSGVINNECITTLLIICIAPSGVINNECITTSLGVFYHHFLS